MPFNSLKALNAINLKEMLLVALNKWYLLVVSLVLSALFSFIYTGFIVQPLYDSTGKIYIQNQESVEEITTNELSISSYLAYDYKDLILDRAILEDVAKAMNYKYSYGSLAGSISVVNPQYTRFIEITVRTPSAKDSKKIVDCLIDISEKKIVQLLNIDRITVIRRGTLSNRPSSPNKASHMKLSLFGGFVAFFSFIAVIYVFDDKVKDANDVQNYLGMTLLGSIPYASGKSARATKT